MNLRERIKATLNGELPDRVAMIDTCYWPETLERWRREGLPENVEPADYFQLDQIFCFGFDRSLQLETERIKETEEYEIATDATGVTCKSWKSRYAPPLQIDFKIKNEKDWQSLKDRLTAGLDRITKAHNKTLEELAAACEEKRRFGHFTAILPGEPCWFTLR